MGNSDIRRSVEGREMGWETWGIEDGHYRTFRKESREFEGGGLGWINGGRKDRGFVWGMIRCGGEQLF